MNKRVVLAVAILLLLNFSGCDRDGSDEPKVTLMDLSSISVTDVALAETTSVDEVEKTSPVMPDSNFSEFFLGATTLSEQVVYQDDHLIISAVNGVTTDLETGFVIIPIQVQNMTSDQIELLAVDGSVNGSMIQTILYASAEPGVKTEASLYVPITELNYASIDLLDELEAFLMLTYAKDESVVYTKSPLHISFDGNGDYSQSFDRSGTVVLDRDGIVATVRPYVDSSESGYNLLVMVENKCDSTVRISLSSVKVNGKSIPTLFYSQVLSGKVAFSLCTFIEQDLSLENITEVQTVEFVIAIEDPMSNEDLFVSEPITLSVS